MEADPIPKKSSARSMLPTVVLVLSAILAAAYLSAPQTIGEQSRRWLLQTLQNQYPNAEITIGKGSYRSDLGLVFENLRIRVPVSGRSNFRDLLQVDQIVVETHFNLQQAMEQQKPFSAKRTTFIGAVLNVWPDEAGWSPQKLWPPPNMGPGCPHLEVQRSRVRLYVDATLDRNTRPIELDDVKLAINSVDASSVSPAKKLFTLRAGSEYARSIHTEGVIVNQNLTVKGKSWGCVLIKQ